MGSRGPEDARRDVGAIPHQRTEAQATGPRGLGDEDVRTIGRLQARGRPMSYGQGRGEVGRDRRGERARSFMIAGACARRAARPGHGRRTDDGRARGEDAASGEDARDQGETTASGEDARNGIENGRRTAARGAGPGGVIRIWRPTGRLES
jgi:hypothetical protein